MVVAVRLELRVRSPVPSLDLLLMVPAKKAYTPFVSVPTASEVGTPVNVATPLASVSVTPAKAPSRVNDTGTPEIAWPDELVRVAVNIAEPSDAVPETFVRLDDAR